MAEIYKYPQSEPQDQTVNEKNWGNSKCENFRMKTLKNNIYVQIYGHGVYHTWNRFSFALYNLKGMNEETVDTHSQTVHPKILHGFKELTEFDALKELEKTHMINWWSNMCRRLYTLKLAPGPGNRLFDACSTAMYGFDDQIQIMGVDMILLQYNYFKKAFQTNITDRLYKRWGYEQLNCRASQNLNPEKEFAAMKENMVLEEGRKISLEERRTIEVYDKFQVYGLCNSIKRPIVVFTQPGQGGNNRAHKLAGVYLPLDTVHLDNCFRFPIVLAYYQRCPESRAIFIPLVQMNSEDDPTSSCLPLVDAQCNLLDVHFDVYVKNFEDESMSVKPLSESDKLKLMMKFMFVTIVETPSKLIPNKTLKIPCARLSRNLPPHFENSESTFKFRLFKLRPRILSFTESPEVKRAGTVLSESEKLDTSIN